ncbi:helix-turn-helix domain-containing protein [Pediococcus ethanolidurans]|uniref:helix-turn-helix domain-containing protein n=1 Tax=Pediococcus ethanolidurans TaxID=319653 RepID=UPI001C1EF068|nr:helix-turn-helix transcriptional regulator [Pediococcus ethanolidurans]MBU7564478.1 helix-turn-helix transcriptional regulator [Pediococcus ethanolidurans]MCV3315891.1 helix-turn-helix transcriptional regulator [Pediococcus ethanolidurans]
MREILSYKRIRQRNGLSQQEVANKLHISRQSVSKWENAHAQPSITNLVKLSHIYHVSLEELVCGYKVSEKRS